MAEIEKIIQKIVAYKYNKPGATAEEIAENLGISKAYVNKILKRIK